MCVPLCPQMNVNARFKIAIEWDLDYQLLEKVKKWKFKKFIKLCAEKYWLILNELNKEYLTMYAKSLKVCTAGWA